MVFCVSGVRGIDMMPLMTRGAEGEGSATRGLRLRAEPDLFSLPANGEGVHTCVVRVQHNTSTVLFNEAERSLIRRCRSSSCVKRSLRLSERELVLVCPSPAKRAATDNTVNAEGGHTKGWV